MQAADRRNVGGYSLHTCESPVCQAAATDALHARWPTARRRRCPRLGPCFCLCLPLRCCQHRCGGHLLAANRGADAEGNPPRPRRTLPTASAASLAAGSESAATAAAPAAAVASVANVRCGLAIVPLERRASTAGETLGSLQAAASSRIERLDRWEAGHGCFVERSRAAIRAAAWQGLCFGSRSAVGPGCFTSVGCRVYSSEEYAVEPTLTIARRRGCIGQPRGARSPHTAARHALPPPFTLATSLDRLRWDGPCDSSSVVERLPSPRPEGWRLSRRCERLRRGWPEPWRTTRRPRRRWRGS
eukprot:364784-Chlamydomonas_euryale.AAC.8